MGPSIEELFQFTRSKVTDQDIVDFSPNDPGYPYYVRDWQQIRHTGEIPYKRHQDIYEGIVYTALSLPQDKKNAANYQRYRRFTSAVCLAFYDNGLDSEILLAPNYLAQNLIVDLDHSSSEYLPLLRRVFPSVRDILKAANNEVDYPFFTFGMMILAQIAGDFDASNKAATELIKDDYEVRNNESLNWYFQSGSFLLGLTSYDGFHEKWIGLASELKNPHDHEDTQYVIESIKEIWE